MKLPALAFLLTTLSTHAATGLPSDRWNTLVLWSNQVLSASLKYLPEASLADEDYMFIELNNHTDKTLEISQAGPSLPATRTDKHTQQSVWMSGIASGVIYFGKLPPGKTRAVQNGVFAAGLANLGLPPKTGYHVEVTPSAEVRLVDGTVFSGAHEKFSFEFNYPNPTEVESIKTRFKQLLARPANQFESGALLNAFSQLPEVRDSVTLDEVLSALKSRSWVDGKAALMTIVGYRFANEPKVLAHFVEQLSHDHGDAFFSFPREVWQNPVFVEPLVKRYERNGNNSRELLELRSLWIGSPQIGRRMSRIHPLLYGFPNQRPSPNQYDRSPFPPTLKPTPSPSNGRLCLTFPSRTRRKWLNGHSLGSEFPFTPENDGTTPPRTVPARGIIMSQTSPRGLLIGLETSPFAPFPLEC